MRQLGLTSYETVLKNSIDWSASMDNVDNIDNLDNVDNVDMQVYDVLCGGG